MVPTSATLAEPSLPLAVVPGREVTEAASAEALASEGCGDGGVAAGFDAARGEHIFVV